MANVTKLVVVEAFDNYERGDVITDAAKVLQIVNSEQEMKVRKVTNTEKKEG